MNDTEASEQRPAKGARTWGPPRPPPPPPRGRPPAGTTGPDSRGSLDNTTNNYAAPSGTGFLDRSTGELLPGYDPTRKWALQRAAKDVLSSHRVHVCMSHVRPDWDEVQVRKSRKSSRAYYAGLMACGSVWVCPVCAAKVQAVRADELRRAIAAWGGSVELLTLTVPHTSHQALAGLLAGLTSALTRFWGSRSWRTLAETYGIRGYVRGLEVTWGPETGWHPHAHIVLFRRSGDDRAELASELFANWERLVHSRGLGQASRQAFSLQDGTHVARYVTKVGHELHWDAADELVRSHSKSGGRSRWSPWDLLGELAYPEDQSGEQHRFAELFREYAEAFHGRRQLVWSRGLRHELLATEELSDQAIADSIGEVDPVLAFLSVEDWRLVRRARLRGTLLLVAELHGADGVRHLLAMLHASPPTPLPTP